MKILLTCPRAPIVLEWIRIFDNGENEIILVDSMPFPIARFYKNTKFVEIASPVLDFNSYKKEMKILINSVDWVIPNCEDIFFLSKVYNSMETNTFMLMPEKDLLFTLHNKYNFFEVLNDYYIKYPKTRYLTSKEDIVIHNNKILKPVYSRFGKNVIMDITSKSIENIRISKEYPWVEQELIKGEAVCNYALIVEGKLIAHTAYKPKYLLNNSASTYFETYFDKRLDRFIEQFAKDTNYTGQVAFDFIDDGKDLYILECNPRATSGLHLLSEDLEFKENKLIFIKTEEKKAYRVGNTLYFMFGLKALINRDFKTLHNDYIKAKNVLSGVSIFNQCLSVLNVLFRTIKHRKNFTAATTFDIEYDGDQ